MIQQEIAGQHLAGRGCQLLEQLEFLQRELQLFPVAEGLVVFRIDGQAADFDQTGAASRRRRAAQQRLDPGDQKGLVM